VEGALTNIVPTFSGPCIWAFIFGKVHLSLFMMALGYRLMQTTESHSGMALPFPVKYLFVEAFFDAGNGTGFTSHHYFHHSHNVGNYSSCLTDRLFGTDAAYKKFIAAEQEKRKKRA